MEKAEAKIIIRSLIGRLKTTESCFELPSGAISALEKEALHLVSDMPPERTHAPTPTGMDLSASSAELNLSCLEAHVDKSAIMCIDFGTAFSKAAIWRNDALTPVPLDLIRGAIPGRTGVLLESSAYISDGRIYFGPAAVERFRLEDAPDRELFSSPKELLTHEASRLDVERPRKGIDPTGRFTSRALLTLYLGYLTAVACAVLPDGIGRTVKRRYAAPGWENVQADTTSKNMGLAARSLGDLLIDAQILADTVDIENWRVGLDVEAALELDAAIRIHRNARGGKAFGFIERAVLEAVAAGSGIRDRFMNQRPQVLVVDVGAGTTDIGVFKYVNAPDGNGVVAPYAGGMRAVQIAGNGLDEALIGLAQQKLGLPSDTDRSRRFKRRLSDVIREAKATLCETGEVEIDVPDFPKTKIELPEFVQTPMVSHYLSEFKGAVVEALQGSGASFRSFADESIAVFTGGGRSLPFLREIFNDPIKLSSGPAHFLMDDGTPEWVGRTLPDVSQVFPQVAVATGGCSPYLPAEARVVGDTSNPGKRHMTSFYKS
jgi:hypothetical protein